MIAIIFLERGMPSRGNSSDCLDYVPAIRTHRPSLLPIGLRIELLGTSILGLRFACTEVNFIDICILEEAKVVTRLLEVNLRQDHYQFIVVKLLTWLVLGTAVFLGFQL